MGVHSEINFSYSLVADLRVKIPLSNPTTVTKPEPVESTSYHHSHNQSP
jgi:hypothetical protein